MLSPRLGKGASCASLSSLQVGCEPEESLSEQEETKEKKKYWPASSRCPSRSQSSTPKAPIPPTTVTPTESTKRMSRKDKAMAAMTKTLSTPVKKPKPGNIKDRDLDKTRPLDDPTDQAQPNTAGKIYIKLKIRFKSQTDIRPITPCDLVVSSMHIDSKINPDTTQRGRQDTQCQHDLYQILCYTSKQTNSDFEMVYSQTSNNNLSKIETVCLSDSSLSFNDSTDPDLASTMRRTMRTLKLSSEEEVNVEDMNTDDDDKVTSGHSKPQSCLKAVFSKPVSNDLIDPDGRDTGGAGDPGRGGLRSRQVRRLSKSFRNNSPQNIIIPPNQSVQRKLREENIISTKLISLCKDSTKYYHYLYLEIINNNDVLFNKACTMKIYDYYEAEAAGTFLLKSQISGKLLVFLTTVCKVRSNTSMMNDDSGNTCHGSKAIHMIFESRPLPPPTPPPPPHDDSFNAVRVKIEQSQPRLDWSQEQYSLLMESKDFSPSTSLLSIPNTFPTPPSASANQHNVKYSSPHRATSASQELMGDIEI